MSTKSNDNFIITMAVNLSVIEVFLGSFLHAMKIPLSGHFLSLNQGFYLTQSSKEFKNRIQAVKGCFEISMITAMMKSLAPATKKLGPMMSISMQGLLFSLGILIFGFNLLGQIIGMLFLSFWAFLQPLITYFLIYGSDLAKAFIYYEQKLGVELFNIILFLIFFKAFIAGLIPIVTRKFSKEKIDAYQNYLQKFPVKDKTPKAKTALGGAIKDLLRPTMIFSFVLMGFFFAYHRTEEGILLRQLIRPIAIAFILFYLLRAQWSQGVVLWMAKRVPYFDRLLKLAQQSRKEI